MNERLSLARLRTFCNHLRYARGQPPADFAVRQQREVERWKVAYSKETSAGPAEAGRVEDMAAEAGTGSRFSVPGDDDEAPTLLPRALVQSIQKRSGATSPAVTYLFCCRQGMIGFRTALSLLPQPPSPLSIFSISPGRCWSMSHFGVPHPLSSLLSQSYNTLLPGGMSDFSFEERYRKQWSALGFSPEGHPIIFLRDALAAQGVAACADLQSAKAGQQVQIGGLIVRPHKPPTAKGVVFSSISDETALVHVAVMPDVYRTYGTAIYGGDPVAVTGRAEKRGEGVSLLANHIPAA